jgi:sterol desaturase/sphingolipid hydroxylase (fatty acid hydroxylase superfamily)
MMNRPFYKFRALGGAVVLAVVAVFGGVTMLLWNWLLPGIFGLPALGYWQALGLFLLCRILFSGVGGGFGAMHRGGMMHGMHDHHHQNPMRERWMNMSDEDRKAFYERFSQFKDMRPHAQGGNDDKHEQHE